MSNIITSGQVMHNQDALYYFRKEIQVKNLTKSIINIFADARYKLYINGNLVAIGPCKQTSETKYYDEVDITEFLNIGANLIDVQVLQLSHNIYDKGDCLLEAVLRSGGMTLCVWGNAGDTEIDTDETWEVARENSIRFFCKPEYGFYNVTALSEDVSLGYGKNLTWQKAIVLNEIFSYPERQENCTLITIPAQKRPIPMVYFQKKNFKGVRNGIYDAGELTCGFIRFKCHGKGRVHLTYAECMVFIEDGSVRKRKRDDENGIIIGNQDTIQVDGECYFDPFWMRTFRFVEVKTEGDIEIESFDYLETGYPIEVSDKYDFGNESDNKLFEISVNTLKRCMHETYMDCPYYEQLQYTMDTHLQILFTYQLTMDKALAEKAIDDFAKSYRVGWITQSRFPTNKKQYIPGFSLFFVMMLYEHAKRFGDSSFIRRYLSIADGVIDWFVKRLDGYMVAPSGNLWDFVDWSEEYDNGQIPEKGPITVYSLMLAYVLEKASCIHEMLGNRISEYGSLSEKIKDDVKKRCFDTKTGLYADSPLKKHFSQHPQIWAVLCDMESGEDAKVLLNKSMGLKCQATSAYMFLWFRAMEKAGIYEKSEEALNSLRSLIPLGCTTTPEWVREDVRSECHAWSAVAIYEFTAKVLGVTYRENTIRIKPYIFGRTFAKGSVATPVGMVYCEWEVRKEKFFIKIDLPEHTDAVLTLPDGTVVRAKSGLYQCDVQMLLQR